MPLSRHPAYAVLAEVSLGYPPQQGRFPRATHPCATPPETEAREAFDLHVLSMPPAFVLSQDQTLMFNPDKPAILSDDRPVVTRPGPRTEDRTQSRATKRSAQAYTPAPTPSQRPDQSVTPRARPTAHAAARASLPSQQCQSAIPPPPSPRSRITPPRSTRRRGRTLIWSPPPTVKPLSKPQPNTAIHALTAGPVRVIPPPSAPASRHPGSSSAPPAAVRRRVGRRQIAPALKRPPRPPDGRDQLRCDLDQAIGAALFVALAAEPGDPLAHPDLARGSPSRASRRASTASARRG